MQTGITGVTSLSQSTNTGLQMNRMGMPVSHAAICMSAHTTANSRISRSQTQEKLTPARDLKSQTQEKLKIVKLINKSSDDKAKSTRLQAKMHRSKISLLCDERKCHASCMY